MSEMVERVAAKIMKDAAVGELLWSVAGEARQEAFRRAAVAAIEAMRDFTPEMLEAGRAKTNWGAFGTDEVWQAMIDAALSPSPEPHK